MNVCAIILGGYGLYPEGMNEAVVHKPVSYTDLTLPTNREV